MGAWLAGWSVAESLAEWIEDKTPFFLHLCLKPVWLAALLIDESIASFVWRTGWPADLQAGASNEMSLLISGGVGTCKIYDLVHLVIMESHLFSETRWHDSCHNTGWWRRRGSKGRTAGWKLTEWKGLKGSKAGRWEGETRERLEQWGGEESDRARWSLEISVCVWERDVDDEALRKFSLSLSLSLSLSKCINRLSYCIRIVLLYCSWHNCLLDMSVHPHTYTHTHSLACRNSSNSAFALHPGSSMIHAFHTNHTWKEPLHYQTWIM